MLGDLDWGPVIAAYVGTLFMAGAGLAICCFLSATTTNQIVAWMFGACVLLVFNLIHLLATAVFVPRWLAELSLNLDMSQHFNAMSRGVIDLSSVGFYIGVMVVALVANTLVLSSGRFR
jgi:ABC-2 type transport system permease protein